MATDCFSSHCRWRTDNSVRQSTVTAALKSTHVTRRSIHSVCASAWTS